MDKAVIVEILLAVVGTGFLTTIINNRFNKKRNIKETDTIDIDNQKKYNDMINDIRAKLQEEFNKLMTENIEQAKTIGVLEHDKVELQGELDKVKRDAELCKQEKEELAETILRLEGRIDELEKLFNQNNCAVENCEKRVKKQRK